MPRKPPPPPRRTPARQADPPPTQRFDAHASPAAPAQGGWSPPAPTAPQQATQSQPQQSAPQVSQPQAAHPSHPQAGAAPPPLPQGYDPLLQDAPAAVRAAADQVMATHRQHGNVQLPQPAAPPPQRPQPKPPKHEESSGHSTSLKKGTVVAKRYRVERMIGRGGMGTVYAVRHLNTDEKLALKLLHPALAENESAVERFRIEARAPVRIESEHVVRVVDADIAESLGDVPFIVMERLRGHDLRGELKRRGALPAGEVVLYLKQVARALDKAHALGIVHRDLKPANMYVLKREDGSPLLKVLDFGIAKLTDDAAQELTVAGQIFGTPWFMAPEQARGDLGKVGPATDLWALGLIAYQLLTGRNYWTAEGMAALVAQICYEEMTPPTATAPHLGPLFDMWFARACNRDPTQRFTTAKEMVGELAVALGVNQTGPSFSTSGGADHHLDSSLQISVPAHTSNPTPAAGVSSPATPGSIPGTSVGSRLESTNPPLYATQQPLGNKRSSSTTAVLLGVVIALIVAGAGAGVWLVMPASPAAATTASAAAAAAAAQAPSKDEDGDQDDDTNKAGDDGDEQAQSDDEPTKDEPPPKESAAPVTKAPPPTPVAVAPPPPRTTKPKPPKAPPKAPPKVAPKVDKIDF